MPSFGASGRMGGSKVGIKRKLPLPRRGILVFTAMVLAVAAADVHALQKGGIHTGNDEFRLRGDEKLSKFEEDQTGAFYIVLGSWTGSSVKTLANWSDGRSSLSLMEIDCARRRHRVQLTEVYAQPMLQGGVTRPSTGPLGYDWLDSASSSLGRKLIGATCTREPDAP